MVKFLDKTSKLLIGILFFFSLSLYGQNNSSHNEKYALQFQVSKNLSLGNFFGNVISGKYLLSNSSSIRVGLTYSQNVKNLNNRTKYENSYSDPALYLLTQSQSNLSCGGKCQYIFIWGKNKKLHMYTGGGLIFSYSRTSSGGVINTSYDHFNSGSSEYSNWSAGLTTLFGAEWFFKDGMSLSAEYEFGYSYKFSKDAQFNNERKTNGRSTYEYYIGGNAVLLGLSVYF